MEQQLVQVTPNVVIEWLQDRRIVVFKIEGVRREDVDVYVQSIRDVVAAWDRTKPYLVLYDVVGTHMTPYTRRRAQDIYDIIPLGFFGRTAIQVSDSVFGFLITSFVNRMLRVQNKGMKRKFFTSRGEALKWLEEGLV